MVNAGWTLSAPLLASALGLTTARVLNDFEALAWALPDLGPSDLVALDDVPRPATGNLAVIGPGTGFGLAALVRGPGDDRPVVTEGGHATLAAEDTREDAVIDCLRAEFGHVSIERVLSGAGLAALYRALAKVENRAVPERDSPAIVARALAGDCAHSGDTLAMFCAFLGSVAGNTALTLGATGGVFIGGGVTPRFRSFLIASSFRSRFEGKGRLQPYLARIPTRLIVHANPAFVGLCRLARQSAE
jgi:glucokinase